MASNIGHCLCKAVKIAVPATSIKRPILSFFCHCVDCQRSAGGPGQAVALYHKDDIKIEDKSNAIKEYIIPGSSTTSGLDKKKTFCSVCACTIASIPSKWKGERVVLRTSLFKDDTGMRPTEEWFTKDRRAWMPKLKDTEEREKARAVD